VKQNITAINLTFVTDRPFKYIPRALNPLPVGLKRDGSGQAEGFSQLVAIQPFHGLPIMLLTVRN
jgi:hypothetical protein